LEDNSVLCKLRIQYDIQSGEPAGLWDTCCFNYFVQSYSLIILNRIADKLN